MSQHPSTTAGNLSGAEFPATHWTDVAKAGSNLPQNSPALNEFCRAYWPPLYAFLRRRGHSPDDAKDLTQGFLARVLARGDLGAVEPEKGRFRTYLLAGLRNFTIKQALHDKALKRGGAQACLSIDGEEGERLCGPDLQAESAEMAYDRRWCRTILTRALQRLRDEQTARGKLSGFEALAPFLDGANPGDYESVSRRLGLAPGAVAVSVHRLRSRLQELIRAEVAQTVASPAQVDEELKHLMDVWRR